MPLVRVGYWVTTNQYATPMSGTSWYQAYTDTATNIWNQGLYTPTATTFTSWGIAPQLPAWPQYDAPQISAPAVLRGVAAAQKARELLLAFLSPAERREFKKHKRITVTAKSGCRYRINDRGVVGNIDVLNGDEVSHRLCVHPPPHLPSGDILLAQLLHLRDGDEAALLRIANRHPRLAA